MVWSKNFCTLEIFEEPNLKFLVTYDVFHGSESLWMIDFISSVSQTDKMLTLNPIKPKLFWGLPGPGGAHCAPLQNFYIFRPIAMKFGTDVKQVMI